jgi:hypothetical protein
VCYRTEKSDAEVKARVRRLRTQRRYRYLA